MQAMTDVQLVQASAPLANGLWTLPAKRTAADDPSFRNPAGEQAHTPPRRRLRVIGR